MRQFRRAMAVALCAAGAAAAQEPAARVPAADTGARTAVDTSGLRPLPRPAVVRGLYVNRWAMSGGRIWELVDVARRTEVNALVIDVKDDRGLVLYRSRVPLVRQIGADASGVLPAATLRAVLDTLRANDIHAIARIVVAKDPLLASKRRAWSVVRRRDRAVWLDSKGNPWLDPHHREVWAYAGDLATEAVRLGFSEVQFDYVRFPDEPQLLREAGFPLAKGRSRQTVIAEQLAYLHERMRTLGVPMAIDVFGATTSTLSDMGIGQLWERFAPNAEIVHPMTYPSHYGKGSYGIARPNAEPYAVIDHAMADAIRRNDALPTKPEILPWYQDFSIGRPRYGVEQIRAQMQAGYDRGVRGWLLWNASSRYTVAALRPAILTEAEESPKRAAAIAADSLRR